MAKLSMRHSLALAGLLMLTVASLSAGAIRGRVFLDGNGNGASDPGEPGVPGCVVSDERTLARTDGTGAYRLELAPGPTAVFVVNAPGTTAAPGRWWTHVEDGAADARFDFPMRAEDQTGPFHFVMGTDLHVTPQAEAMVRRYVDHVNALPVPVKFVVHTGDLVMDSTRTTLDQARVLFDLYEDTVRPLTPPLRNVMGNHDIAGVAHSAVAEHEPDFGKALYRRRLGPATYAFRHGRHHFIALDGTMIQERAIVYGLTRESADWAIRYLADVRPDEPVVLLMHEPMFPEKGGVQQPDTPATRPHEARLRAALAGKKLLMTLAGHAHSRSETTWAGAPHILGGAVSYAWHGLRPYPPAPRAYLLFRLEGDRAEHVYLDWAEERSIDIATPAFNSLVRGRQPIGGVIADPTGEITAVRCALADRAASATIARRGALATAFNAALDTEGLPDGAYDLVVTASGDGPARWIERQPVVVVNGVRGEFATAEDATLSFRVEGTLPAGTRILCNGHSLAAGSGGNGFEVRCEVPAGHLRRLNEVVIDPGPAKGAGQAPILRGVTLEHGGKRRRDVRHSPLERRPLRAPVVSWIDLVYEEPAP